MALTNPLTTTAFDLCTEALYESGAFGRGQTIGSDDLDSAQARLTLMLNEWMQKRWMIWHLVDMRKISTGATAYTVGPGGDFNTGSDSAGFPVSQRPAKIEAAYLRILGNSGPFNNQFNNQFASGAGNLPVDQWMTPIQSMEEWSRIRVKKLVSYPGWFFYDTAIPLGVIYCYPIAQANIYEIHILVRDQLPPAWASSASIVTLPFEYYSTILYNLAIRMRSRYTIPTWPGDSLPALAKNSLATVRGPNVQIGQLAMPGTLRTGSGWNIFTDN